MSFLSPTKIVIAVVIIIVAAGGLMVASKPIISFLLPKVIRKYLANAAYQFEDGLHAVLLGTCPPK